MSDFHSVVLGTGAFLPKRIMTNADMEKIVDTTDDWIRARTGIEQRHIAEDGETTSMLALEAGSDALKNAGLTKDDLDLIILATTTPDQTFPATATKVQAALGMHHGAAFDVQAVCSGFIYALSVADNFIRSGQVRNALVIGAETFSRILDWTDRSTCVLFGDGAGAVVLGREQGRPDIANRGIYSTHLHSDGAYNELLYVDGGPSSTKTVGHVQMAGPEVFKHAVTNLAAVVNEALDGSNLSASAIDWFVPHQANRRIIDATVRKLNADPERVVCTVQKHGNTSAASVPLALHEIASDGRLKRDQLVLMEAMGGGLALGSALLRW